MLLNVLPMMYFDFDLLIPLGICVILPVTVVALVMSASRHDTDRKAEVLLKAIENGQQIPSDAFDKKEKKAAVKTIKERLLKRFHSGCICTGLGLAFIAMGFIPGIPGPQWGPFTTGAVLLPIGLALIGSYFMSRAELKDEIEAEKKSNIEKNQ